MALKSEMCIVLVCALTCGCQEPRGWPRRWDGRVVAIPSASDPRFPEYREEDQQACMMGPNYELELVTILPVVLEAGESQAALPERIKPAPHVASAGRLTFAVDAQGFIYVGVPAQWGTVGGRRVPFMPASIIKLDPNGKPVGRVVGGVPEGHDLSKGSWARYYEQLRKGGNGFFDISKMVPDADGHLYVFWERAGYRNGCVSVCAPKFMRARLLDIGMETHPIGGIVYNPETGGVVVKEAGHPNTDNVVGYYVELRKGKVIREKLPTYHMSEQEKKYALALGAGHATLWCVDRRLSEDRERLLSATLQSMGTFELDLRARSSSALYIGRSNRHGWVFNILLEPLPGQTWRDRVVLLLGGDYDYVGHLVPPFRGEHSAKLVGLNGEYYEFTFLPGRAGLHVYRARKSKRSSPRRGATFFLPKPFRVRSENPAGVARPYRLPRELQFLPLSSLRVPL